MSVLQALDVDADQASTNEDATKLLIVIPAYNEEQSIKSIIERSLDACAYICEHAPVDEVEITVVSDGSVDRTVEYASTYLDQIKLIVFEENRGYGAAIKEGWDQSDATLLSFLDADGTCDPRFFASLCTRLDQDNADVVLGCRMNSESEMPLVRKVGNFIFASMLSVFSSTRVRDSASGMRVVRRDSLPKLYPLPDGLHFTPAMSARAVLSKDLKISEIDMPYREREGESKLKAGKDGLRFLRVILESAFLYRPSRLLALFGGLCLVAAFALMITPFGYYLNHQAVQEWMIYRFIVSDLLGTSAVLLLCAGFLSQKIVRMALDAPSPTEFHKGFLAGFFSTPYFWVIPVLLIAAGVVLVASSFAELVATGATYEHWSRFIAMSFLVATALILIVTRVLDYILGLIAARLSYLRTQSG